METFWRTAWKKRSFSDCSPDTGGHFSILPWYRTAFQNVAKMKRSIPECFPDKGQYSGMLQDVAKMKGVIPKMLPRLREAFKIVAQIKGDILEYCLKNRKHFKMWMKHIIDNILECCHDTWKLSEWKFLEFFLTKGKLRILFSLISRSYILCLRVSKSVWGFLSLCQRFTNI